MTARLCSWWQKIKKHPVATVINTVAIALIALVLLGGYQFHWGWTGFNGSDKSGKTLWDWIQLLFIPVVLAGAGFWFNHRERTAAERRAENEQKAAMLHADAEREIEQQRAKAERGIALDNQREAALKEHIYKISELLLHENLRKSEPEDEVRKIARVLTLTVLPRLDGSRKKNILQFLYESGLIDKRTSIIDLEGADLSQTNLSPINLEGANLSQIDLSGADLSGSALSDTSLRACLIAVR